MARWIIIGVLLILFFLTLGSCIIEESRIDDLEAQLSSSEHRVAELEAQVTDLEQELDSLNTDYTELNTRYEDLSAKYPPRDFWSVEELVEWLARDTTDKLYQADPDYDMGDAAARLCNNAIDEGYLLHLYPLKVSEDYFEYQLQVCAIIAGSAYLVNPATDDVTQIGTSGIYGDYF